MGRGRRIVNHGPKATRKRAYYRQLVARQTCAHCCRRKATGGILCQRCRARQRHRLRMIANERRAAGLCRDCGWPSQGRSKCMTCALRRKQIPSRQPGYRRKLREEGRDK